MKIWSNADDAAKAFWKREQEINSINSNNKINIEPNHQARWRVAITPEQIEEYEPIDKTPNPNMEDFARRHGDKSGQ